MGRVAVPNPTFHRFFNDSASLTAPWYQRYVVLAAGSAPLIPIGLARSCARAGASGVPLVQDGAFDTARAASPGAILATHYSPVAALAGDWLLAGRGETTEGGRYA